MGYKPKSVETCGWVLGILLFVLLALTLAVMAFLVWVYLYDVQVGS